MYKEKPRKSFWITKTNIQENKIKLKFQNIKIKTTTTKKLKMPFGIKFKNYTLENYNEQKKI